MLPVDPVINNSTDHRELRKCMTFLVYFIRIDLKLLREVNIIIIDMTICVLGQDV